MAIIIIEQRTRCSVMTVRLIRFQVKQSNHTCNLTMTSKSLKSVFYSFFYSFSLQNIFWTHLALFCM